MRTVLSRFKIQTREGNCRQMKIFQTNARYWYSLDRQTYDKAAVELLRLTGLLQVSDNDCLAVAAKETDER